MNNYVEQPPDSVRCRAAQAWRPAGFTLVELVITVVIGAILVTAALPAFRDMTQNNRIIVQANELLAALSLARTEAVKRLVAVRLCKSIAGSSCASGSDWEQGWIVFSDSNGNGLAEPGTGACLPTEDCIIKNAAGRSGGGTTVTSSADFIEFKGSGSATNAAAVTISATTGSGTISRYVCVNTTGRANVQQTACP